VDEREVVELSKRVMSARSQIDAKIDTAVDDDDEASELRLTVDFGAGRYGARRSSALEPPERNLSWLGYPIVRLASEKGQPLLFGLDTGSRNTSISDNAFRKVELGLVREETTRIGGVGGFVEADVRVAERLGLALAGRHVVLANVPTESESGSEDVFFLQADGVLGSDVFQGERLVLDYGNGWIGFE